MRCTRIGLLQETSSTSLQARRTSAEVSIVWLEDYPCRPGIAGRFLPRSWLVRSYGIAFRKGTINSQNLLQKDVNSSSIFDAYIKIYLYKTLIECVVFGSYVKIDDYMIRKSDLQ